jgi:HK97 family phage major capsid protein
MAQLTWEFIQDEDVSFVSRHLAEAFGESSGRALNKALTDGDGSRKPTGILDATNGASVGKELASQTAITKVEVIDLIHSVDPAYRTGPNVAFMFHDNILAAIRKLDFGTTDDEPIWQPSYREGEPDRILGYRYVINQDFPSTIVQSNKIAAFGDWSKYVVRQVQDFQLLRLNERFADQLSTGFLGWLRIDGKLLQSAAIKLLQAKTS